MKPSLLTGLFPLICASIGFAQSPTPKPKATPLPVPEGVTVQHNVETGQGGNRPLHAEVAYPTALPDKPMPAVIWIHGGGWVKGSHHQNLAMWMAAHGYFTASIEYRLAMEAPWPAQIEDCKLAVRWLRANAEKFHVDPNRIAVWGASAGGHLVTCLGTMNDPKFEGNGGYPGVSSRVQAVIDYCGPVDFSTGSHAFLPPPGQTEETFESKALTKFMGAPFKEKPETWKEASPLGYVTSDDPPFLIAHGSEDDSIRIDQPQKLQAALQKAGVPSEFVFVKGAPHNIQAATGPTEPSEAELEKIILTFLDKYMNKPAP